MFSRSLTAYAIHAAMLIALAAIAVDAIAVRTANAIAGLRMANPGASADARR